MAEFRLRRHNQFTMPAAVVKATGLVAGDRVRFEIDPADPDTITVRLLDRRSDRSGRPDRDAPGAES